MKVRIRVPNNIYSEEDRARWIDDILFWGMEMSMDVDYYALWRHPDSKWNDREYWAVFSIEEESAFMFILKWGALLHKDKKKRDDAV